MEALRVTCVIVLSILLLMITIEICSTSNTDLEPDNTRLTDLEQNILNKKQLRVNALRGE